MRKILIALFMIIILAASFDCAERERLNPIDPKNPETGGRPRGLKIYSEYDRAILEWSAVPVENFLGYKIYRRSHADPSFQFFYQTPPESSIFIDKRLTYGLKYHYQISVLGADFESERSDTVSIIPGPSIIWATDVYNRRIMKISHDGAHEIRQLPVTGYPWDIVVDRESGTIWYVDILSNQVYLLLGESYQIVASLPTGEPSDIALDVANYQVWVADETQGKIFVFNKSGEQLYEIDGFQTPASLDCFEKDGSCWIADTKTKVVTKLSKKGTIRTQIKNLIFPRAVSVNQTTGECWIADSSRILKYDQDGNLLMKLETAIRAPFALSVDSDNGTCWILDANATGAPSRLMRFTSNGDIVFELSTFNWLSNLVVNPIDHSCIVAETGTGRILKISEDGTIFGISAGYVYPRGLYLEYERQN